MQKPVILTFVKNYLPGYKAGGPLRSVSNLVEWLGDEFEFRIVTLDRDYGDLQPFPGITTETWTPVGNGEVMYLPRRSLGIGTLRRILSGTHHDILYFNSFFDVLFTLLPAICASLSGKMRKPVVIAPRGEFSEGAIALKAWKKRPYVWLMRRSGVFRGACWQASSEHEAADIRREFGADARISVASNLPAAFRPVPAQVESATAAGGALRVIFVSRISPKKNLDVALGILAKISCPVSFNIVGPTGDDEYHARCVELARSLPAHVSVEWTGGVDNSEVPGLMAGHDLFFLPTRGENYGHVIAEALAAGTPVLLADTTPWRDLEAHGVGWDLPLADEDRFVHAIEAAARKSPAERARWRSAVLDFARRRLADPDAARANRELFTRALASC